MPYSPTAGAEFVCDCEEQTRSACFGEPYYKTYQNKSYCVLHFPGQEKSEDFKTVLERRIHQQLFDFGGFWFPGDMHFANFRFRSEVNFSFATFTGKADFGSAVFTAQSYFRFASFNSKVDFRLAQFNGDADFYSARFSLQSDFANASFGRDANFDETTFNETSFAYADFQGRAQFRIARVEGESRFTSMRFGSEATFNSAEFGSLVDFSLSRFKKEVDFSSAAFKTKALLRQMRFDHRVDFSYATFNGDTDFTSTEFASSANFSFAAFAGYLSFVGEGDQHLRNKSFDFRFAKIERPDLVAFNTHSLLPHWFVNIDTRSFHFAHIDWGWKRKMVSHELKALAQKNLTFPHKMLALTCAQLSQNAEENHRYEEASKFRYLAMDARRLESWSGFAPWRLSWWYWLASGYGERVFQAFLVLLGIWLVAGLLYTWVGFARWEPRITSEGDAASATRDTSGAPLQFSRALTYSAGVMTLQKPEPRPTTIAAQTVVILETILGPVQAALLALAIRRKFMR